MRNHPLFAGLLSLVAPGAGQFYLGKGERGAAILVGAITLTNLNLIFLLAIASVNAGPSASWAYWIARAGYAVVVLGSAGYWAWAAVDAYRMSRMRLLDSPV